MQAIARANRVHEGKNNGLVVDYCGILKHLRSALATFASGDEGGGTTDPTKPDEELLAELAEAIGMVRAFLDDGGSPLDDVINKTDFEQIAAIAACKEVANENDETRKRFEVMCREVFKKFKFCLTKDGVNAYRNDRDAINIIYKMLQRDRERADISDVIRKMHAIVDEAIDVNPDGSEDSEPYDISNIDFDRLKAEFERSPRKKTTVQNLRESVEQKLRRLLSQNPLRTDFQKHYEEIVKQYNNEKDRVTIEQTFEALLKLVKELDEEESRAVSEGLTDETLAIFDLLKKPSLEKDEVKRIKAVAADLLQTLKAEKLKVDQWRDKESTRDGVKQAIHDHLWADTTGLPGSYSQEEIKAKADEVFRHVFRAYPRVPSPIYEAA
jgi:type I restriction enzyme R subunit